MSPLENFQMIVMSEQLPLSVGTGSKIVNCGRLLSLCLSICHS